MKNTFIISLLLILTIGCTSKSRKQEEIRNSHKRDSLKLVYQQDSLQKAKFEIEKQLIQDSIIKEEEKIAISDIRFGINQKEFKIKEKIFLKTLYDNESKHTQIGEFQFDLFPCFTEGDSLFSLCLKESNKIYKSEGYQSLVAIFSAKYSEPDVHNGLPNWNEKNHELVWNYQNIDDKLCGNFTSGARYKECDVWIIGNKRIEIRYYYTGKPEYVTINGNAAIVPNSYKYGWLRKLTVVIYHKGMFEKHEQKKRADYEKALYQERKKEKEEKEKSIEKAVKIL